MYILSYGSSYDFIILWLSDSYVDIIYIYIITLSWILLVKHILMFERCDAAAMAAARRSWRLASWMHRCAGSWLVFFFFKLGLETVQLRKMCLFKDLFLIFFWLSHFFWMLPMCVVFVEWWIKSTKPLFFLTFVAGGFVACFLISIDLKPAIKWSAQASSF